MGAVFAVGAIAGAAAHEHNREIRARRRRSERQKREAEQKAKRKAAAKFRAQAKRAEKVVQAASSAASSSNAAKSVAQIAPVRKKILQDRIARLERDAKRMEAKQRGLDVDARDVVAAMRTLKGVYHDILDRNAETREIVEAIRNIAINDE